jgi:hypothetical protein
VVTHSTRTVSYKTHLIWPERMVMHRTRTGCGLVARTAAHTTTNPREVTCQTCLHSERMKQATKEAIQV